jgi:uncharacterized protein (TIRG00374 family)
VGLPPEGAPEQRRTGAALKFAVRVVVGVGVLAFIALRNPSELWSTLRHARPGWVALAAALWFAGIFVSTMRWRAYLDALELHMPLPTLVRLYFVGTFFNAFLPTGIGGDAYKAVRIGRDRNAMTNAFASVFLDRFAGIVALAVIGLAGVGSELARNDKDLRVALLSFALCAAVLVAALLLLGPGERLLGKGKWIKSHGIGGTLRRAVRAIHTAGRHRDAATRGAIYGVLFQFLVVGYHLAIAHALRITLVSVGAMTGIVVVASLATMIPLTVNGLGFRETAYVWGLATFGVAHAHGRAFAILVLAVLLAASLAGGLVYVIAGGEVRSKRA